MDQDCDDRVDEGTTTTWYADEHGDSYGAGELQEGCEAPAPHADNDADCDDTEALLFPEPDGRCADGFTCLDILNDDATVSDGLFLVDPDGSRTGAAPTTARCDMANGGWMLVGRQNADQQLTRTVDDIALDAEFYGSWDGSQTHRWGNARLAAASPTEAWRITSHEQDGSSRDEAFFVPACVIDWDAYVGTFKGERTEQYDDCGVAYTDSTFTAMRGPGNTENNCSLGIGQNNSGAYCSIRMSSCNCYNATCQTTWADEEGVATHCAYQDWNQVTLRLWVR